jgi:hypothetical protein
MRKISFGDFRNASPSVNWRWKEASSLVMRKALNLTEMK